jgi:hypothetical protein
LRLNSEKPRLKQAANLQKERKMRTTSNGKKAHYWEVSS